ncbi:MAG TPA: GNAT family N-acetyltransferase [Falsiroseomonas sp.]|jgi:GNAT superfamily N-acetyltransferase|nr:GNAT family N-acetyltransferase [Falsiroseomonas sp.]
MRLVHPVRVARLAVPPDGFEELAADALADGERMLEVLREDWNAGLVRFDAPGEALFAAYAGDALLGLCGLTRDPYLKAEAVGRVRRFYVRRAARRHGAGRALLAALAEGSAAAGWPRLRVRAPVSAFAFYERCGFLRAVGEPSATHVRVAAEAARLTPAMPARP